MNILLAGLNYKPHFGGIENSFAHMAKEFERMGHNVVIAVGDKPVAGNKRLPKHEILDGINVFRFRRSTATIKIINIIRPLIDIYSSAILFYKLNAKYYFDLVVSRDSHVGLGASFVINKSKHYYVIPAITSIQDKIPFRNLSGNKLRRHIKHFIHNNHTLKQKRFFQSLLISRVSRTIVFSDNMRKQLFGLTTKTKYKVVKIKPGVDTDRFFLNDDKESIRNELNIPLDKHVFLIVSRLVLVKGIDLAIKAFSQLDKNKAFLVIVGDGPEKMRLHQIVRELHLHENVSFIKATRNVVPFYQASDTFVMSSTYEPFGQTILEALASGLPVIGFDSQNSAISTATNEIVEHGENGFLCGYTLKALSNTMDNQMILDFMLRNKIRRNNVLKAKSYSWLNFCEAIIDQIGNKN